tara:strand:- start:141 stop:953 length:813 start_codon:yes stop_codon:yes gene_type:complete
MSVINQFEGLNPIDIYSKDYPTIKSNLQRITTKLTKIIDAIAKEKKTKFTPEQKRGLISEFVKIISTDYIVLPKEAKNKMEGINGKSTKKLIDTIKSKIKEYIENCNTLEPSMLGRVKGDEFVSEISEKISNDELKSKLIKFLGVKKEDKIQKLIELIKAKGSSNNSKGKGLIFSLVTSMAGINKTNNSSDSLYYDIISNQFISDICDLIDLCTVTKNMTTGQFVNVEYIIDDNTSIAGDGASILNKDNQKKLNEIIQKVVNYRTQVTES